ncbi:hypothetical protein DBV08_19795 [Rhodococcus sp. KBW08]|nr:hypothetical protein DBV08_19795 [Rhodococcus sp. KBW08]
MNTYRRPAPPGADTMSTNGARQVGPHDALTNWERTGQISEAAADHRRGQLSMNLRNFAFPQPTNGSTEAVI